MFSWTRTTALLALALLCPTVSAQTPEDAPLTIGTKEAAPFSFKDANGEWQGLSIELWRMVADDLGVEYTLEEAPLTDLVEGLTDGRFDASVAALTVTPSREEILDFAHAFHPSGLGIAVPAVEEGGLSSVLSNLFTLSFLKAVGTLLVVLFLGGALLWVFERKRNPEQFGGSTKEGLGSAFWWSAVTMTTVGYGDKAPVSTAGRIMGVVWMFAGVITISGLTATIASSLTVSRLEHSIQGPEDLPELGRIACVTGSTGEEYLTTHGVGHRGYPTATAALEALAAGDAKAVVYDQPILRYLTRDRFSDEIDVLPVTFERQDYAFALPLESPLRKAVNKSLLRHLSGDDWLAIRERYLGE